MDRSLSTFRYNPHYFTWDLVRNYYERRILQSEDLVPPWIQESDIETDLMSGPR